MASELKVNTLTGVSTAGSIAVTGEGNSTTTNLQQGLDKAWANIAQASSAPSLADSLNCASIADTTAGEATVTLTNNMGNSNYVCVANQQDFAVEHQSPSISTSTFAIRFIADSSGARADIGDGTNAFSTVIGDLA